MEMTRDRLDRWVRAVAGSACPGVPMSAVLSSPAAIADPEPCLAARLACFTFDGAHLGPARSLAWLLDRADVVAETGRLADLYAPIDLEEPSRAHLCDAFAEFAAARGARILRVLQEGTDAPNARTWVFLVVDADGVAKVWKEVDGRAYDASRWRQCLLTEDALFERAGRIEGLVRSYGTDRVGGVPFLRREMAYGQSLLDFVRDGRGVGDSLAGQLVAGIARVLASLHARGIVTGDLRPQNVLVGTDGTPVLFDLGLGYAVGDHALADHDAFVTDPRYLAPEMLRAHRLGRHTEVFQLGQLYHQLRYGGYAFAPSPFPWNDDDFEGKTMAFGLPSALLPYDGEDGLLRKMLDPDPAARPTMEEVADALSRPVRAFVAHPPRHEKPVDRPRDMALVPARIGVPHRGHVDLIARTIDIGYHALVSLQRAYTITEDDPYPKWDVARMVARSLMRLGYVPGQDFSFTFTRLFEWDDDHGLHFAMLPWAERVDALVTGNDGARRLLARPVISQKALFGAEGEDYELRSWGARLRRAIREDDEGTFRDLAACGVEDIMAFSELRAAYARVPVEFVPGCERFVLTHAADGRVLAAGRIRRYGTVDDHVVARLTALGHAAALVDPWLRYPLVAINNEVGELRYDDAVLLADGNLLVPIEFRPLS